MFLKTSILLICSLLFVNAAPSKEDVGPLPILRMDDKKYHVVSNYRMNFLQAFRYCKNINMSLLTITSPKENEAVYNLIRQTDAGNIFWSSATRIVDGKSWIWLTTGNAVKYTNWDNGQPDNKNHYCLDLRIDGRNKVFWTDEDCNVEKPFICQEESKTDNELLWSNIVKSSFDIKSNLVKVGKKVYYFSVNFRGSFWKAQQFCNSLGLKSASINNADENDALYRYVRDTNVNSGWWTSGTRILDDVTWFWLSSGHKIEYANWRNGEPNNVNERCIHLVLERGSNGLFYNDLDCKFEDPVICEKSDTQLTGKRFKRTLINWKDRADSIKTANNWINSGDKSYHIETEFIGTPIQAIAFCNKIDMLLINKKTAQEIGPVLMKIDAKGPFWTSTRIVTGPTGDDDLISQTKVKSCLQVEKSGSIIEHDCNDFFPFICEKQRTTSIPEIPVINQTSEEIKNTEETEECEQPVINIYINNNAAASQESISSPIRIDENVVSYEKSVLVKNKWNSCKH